jgi:hypothetical protein
MFTSIIEYKYDLDYIFCLKIMKRFSVKQLFKKGLIFDTNISVNYV